MFKLNFKKFAAAVTIMLIAALPVFGREAFVIEDYSVSVDVDSARVHHVSEVISLNFSSQRHGIVREIPLSSSEEGYLIKNIAVEGESFSVSREDDTVSIKIGSDNRTVMGGHTYKISYDMVFAADDYEDFDLVYISPIGADWDTDIENVSVLVTLPTENIYGVKVTYGPYGSEEVLENYSISGNAVTLGCGGLKPYEGVSLWIEVPEGSFCDAPKSLSGAAGAVVWLLAALAVGLALWAAVRWFKFGRDERIIPVVEFYPPDGLSPAEMEYVMERNVSDQTLASMIFFWASKGFIQYEETGKNNFRMIKLKDMEGRPQYEKTCFDGLFRLGSGGKVSKKEIEKGFYTHADTVRLGAEAAFEGERSMDSAESGKKSVILMALNFIPCLALTAVTMISGRGFMPLIGVGAEILIYILVKKFFQTGHNGKAKTVALAVLAAIIAAALTAALPPLISALPFAGAGKCALILGGGIAGEIFAALAIRRSDYAEKITGRCLGFADFLKTAEKERIERLIDENPSYYFDTLPYASALGVTKVWADKFADLVKEPPRWYRSDTDVFTAAMLGRSVNNGIRAVERGIENGRAAARASSGGSIRGGGGFSGGGAGGGGGHSW